MCINWECGHSVQAEQTGIAPSVPLDKCEMTVCLEKHDWNTVHGV